MRAHLLGPLGPPLRWPVSTMRCRPSVLLPGR